MYIGPSGPTAPQATTREPGEDEYTAVAEQEVQCGKMAKVTLLRAPTRGAATVRGFASEAQRMEVVRNKSNQV